MAVTGRGVLFVDDEPENVELAAEIVGEATGRPVAVAGTAHDAITQLEAGGWALVVMDLFLPDGGEDTALGPRGLRYEDRIEHLGGLRILDALEAMVDPPCVVSHTACTDHVLLELFGERVVRRIPKPAPLDTLLANLMEVLEELG